MLNKQRKKDHVELQLPYIDELPKDKPTDRYNINRYLKAREDIPMVLNNYARTNKIRFIK